MIYLYRHRSDFYQIAVIREKNGYYGQGTELDGVSYAVTGMQKFKTALGAESEILVLKKVK